MTRRTSDQRYAMFTKGCRLSPELQFPMVTWITLEYHSGTRCRELPPPVGRLPEMCARRRTGNDSHMTRRRAIAGLAGLIFGLLVVLASPASPASAHAALLGAARYLGYAGLVLVVGPAMFLALLWPRRLSKRGPLNAIRGGIGLLALSTLAEQYLQAPYHAGSGLIGASAEDLREVFNS